MFDSINFVTSYKGIVYNIELLPILFAKQVSTCIMLRNNHVVIQYVKWNEHSSRSFPPSM